MKRVRIVPVVLAILFVVPAAWVQNARAQEKNGQTATAEKESGTPLKIQVVISEFDGSKKISSFPYTLHATTEGPAGPHRGATNSMRYGVKVPILVGEHDYTYESVGTNIDYGAYEGTGGNYELVFTVDRSWVGMLGKDDDTLKTVSATAVSPGRPLLPTFRNSFTLVLGNGQTAEGVSAVDPVTGHVLKVDVTLTVLK